MGYVFMTGTCVNCGKVFNFNPIKVPSIRINGIREPICGKCIEKVNPIRKERGLPEIEIEPDAYDWCREEELP